MVYYEVLVPPNPTHFCFLFCFQITNINRNNKVEMKLIKQHTKYQGKITFATYETASQGSWFEHIWYARKVGNDEFIMKDTFGCNRGIPLKLKEVEEPSDLQTLLDQLNS